MKIILVTAARPNFIKIAPLLRAIKKHNASIERNFIDPFLVHTGQHYDYEMSQVFFKDLHLPKPDIHLEVGSGTHAEQTGKIMIEFEKLLFQEKPNLVVVVGDVNSTLAAALAAVKLHIPIAHIEAGVRCYDKSMPEEVNRLLTDAVSDYLFTPSLDADENLRKEGIPQERIIFVGNIMVDSLIYNQEKANQRPIIEQLGLGACEYALLTLHRPSSVDDREVLSRIVDVVNEISSKLTVIFPCHPRTKKNLSEFGIDISSKSDRFRVIAPLGYLDFLQLQMHARFVMTDSGGVQVETTVLGVPCLTLIDASVWPITVSEGTNIIVGNKPQRIIEEALKILNKSDTISQLPDIGHRFCPQLWDGNTAERIVETISRNHL